MGRILILLLLSLAGATSPRAAEAQQPASASTASGLAPDVISEVAARIIAAEIPHEYERSKDWGRTKEVTTGLRSSGNFFKFDIHRKRSEVHDGVWKKYRLTLVEPEKNLVVSIENLRTLESGRIALTLNVAAKLHGWARIKVYESGVHIIAVEAEGDTTVKLSLDATIGVRTLLQDGYLPVVEIDPIVAGARLNFKEFELRRISNVRGAFAHEVGILLREAVEDELKGPKLAEKINASIKKHPERLRFSPEILAEKGAKKAKAQPPAATLTR